MDELFFENETRKHQQQVAKELIAFATNLLDRATKHDASKLQEPERGRFIVATPKLRDLTYGSPEYKQALEELGPALTHHYENNPHHPEYHDSLRDMTLCDLVEMFCDWTAAVKRHADGDIFKSIDHNEKRFGMPKELAEIFRQTARLYG